MKTKLDGAYEKKYLKSLHPMRRKRGENIK